jgi:hypothetical protein
MSSETKSPKELEAMRASLVEARRAARGLKDSARNLRAAPKSERLQAITEAAVAQYDAAHPAPPREDTTRRTHQ